MPSSAPSMPFEHAIDVPKGWFDMTALDFVTRLSSNVTFDVPAGRIVHLNSNGEFEMGVHQTGMPLVLLTGSTSFDVANPGTSAAGNFIHQTVLPAGNMTGLVCKGGYEIQSTEFDTTRNYVPGQLLTAAANNSNAATGGVLTNAGTGTGGDVRQFVDPVCGVVARGVLTNHHGVQVLDFWPEWLPGAYV